HSCFFSSHYYHPLDLHSFPTRRSSDLNGDKLHLMLGGKSSQRTYGSFAVAAGLKRINRSGIQQFSGGIDDGDFDSGTYARVQAQDRKSTRLNSSHVKISYAVFCLKKKK